MELTNEKLLYWKGYEKDTSPEGMFSKTIPVIKSKDQIKSKIDNIARKYKEDFGKEFEGFSSDAIEMAKAVAAALIDRDQYCGVFVLEAVLFQETT